MSSFHSRLQEFNKLDRALATDVRFIEVFTAANRLIKVFHSSSITSLKKVFQGQPL